MNVAPLLSELGNATESSDRLDAAVALVAGYRPITGTGQFGEPRWRDPSGGEVDRVPSYTSSIDAAVLFALEVTSTSEWGCAWEPGAASASIAGQPPSQGANPAIAICIAAIKAKFG